MTDIQAASVSGYLDTWFKLSGRMWQKGEQESIYGQPTDEEKSVAGEVPEVKAGMVTIKF